MSWGVEALLIGGEGRADITPIGALGEVDHEIDVLALPVILHGAVFVLGFEGLDLETVGMGAIRDDEVDGVSASSMGIKTCQPPFINQVETSNS